MIKINENFSKIETSEHFVYSYTDWEKIINKRWLKWEITDIDAEKELKWRLEKISKPQAKVEPKIEEKKITKKFRRNK